MDSCYLNTEDENSKPNPGQNIIMHPLYLPKLSPMFDLRVFYVRVSNCEIDHLTPDHLTVHHIPLTPDTILEVNGRRSTIYSDFVSSCLRRDRVDKRSEEATFVSTDSIRMTGNVRFEVYDKDDLLLAGVLELSKRNDLTGETKNHSKKWGMRCQAVVQAGSGFLRGRLHMSTEMSLPKIEVYVAGCFAGTPIILSKALQLGFRRKHQMKVMLDSIPETTELTKEEPPEDFSQYRCYKPENSDYVDCNSIYSRHEYVEDDDGELSWFNAGVRVGVGIGLGVCLGVGIGVGLFVRTYQATTRTFKRRLI
ncbi:uncharacterized protein At1g01500-like [Typha angustifolia]|uniref:uncharacterized protein At1g01500-like n=1 Tax=Typha angustifolia TaxID=59011 RepID=UPI003C2BA883